MYQMKRAEEPGWHVDLFPYGCVLRTHPVAAGWACVLRHYDHVKIMSGSDPSRSSYRMHLVAAIGGLRQLKWPCIVDMYAQEEYLLECGRELVSPDQFNRFNIAVRTGKAKNADLWREFHRLNEIHWIRLCRLFKPVPQEYGPMAKLEAGREAQAMWMAARANA